jgi:N-formylglutamate amidohydrolase
MDKKESHNHEIPGIYRLIRPQAQEVPLLLDSPHSGRIYPADFQHACTAQDLQRAEDNEVDHLLSETPMAGATLLCALFPRTYIDVNRAEDDLDTELLSERWPGPLVPTHKSHGGIGLIRRIIRPGVPVYDRTLSVAEIETRLRNYYHPYHAVMKSILDDFHYRYGRVWHFNMHSMPSYGASPIAHGLAATQPDFVLGDRDGSTCSIELRHFLRDTLKNMGYRVAINNPYKGVEIIRRSASPHTGRHAIQIEINKALYWNEDTQTRKKNFEVLRTDINTLIAHSADYIQDQLIDLAAD